MNRFAQRQEERAKRKRAYEMSRLNYQILGESALPGDLEILAQEINFKNTPLFESELFMYIQQYNPKNGDRIVLDFKHVKKVDCAGTAALVLAQTKTKKRGLTMVLKNLNQMITAILQIEKLDAVFIYD